MRSKHANFDSYSLQNCTRISLLDSFLYAIPGFARILRTDRRRIQRFSRGETNKNYNPKKSDFSKAFESFSEVNISKLSGSKEHPNEVIFSNIINTKPFGRKDDSQSILKDYCEKMSLILQSLKTNSTEIQTLFTLLSQKLYDFGENIDQIKIQEKRLNRKLPEFNIDYTQFYKTLQISLKTWRFLIRANSNFPKGHI